MKSVKNVVANFCKHAFDDLYKLWFINNFNFKYNFKKQFQMLWVWNIFIIMVKVIMSWKWGYIFDLMSANYGD